MNEKSQRERILKDLKRGKSLTPADGRVEYGCDRLSARIHELRKQGHNIVNLWHTTMSGKRVAKYRLVRK